MHESAKAVAPANAATTTPKPTKNADGSQTFYHTDASGKKVGTTVVDSSGQVLTTHQTLATGVTITEDRRSGVKVVTDPNSNVRTTSYASGFTRRESLNDGPIRYAEEARYRRQYRYTTQAETWGPSVVYVNQPDQSIFNNPFFWLWLNSRNQNQQQFPGGTYHSSGSGGSIYAQTTTSNGANIAMSMDREFDWNWLKVFPDLPDSVPTTIRYKSPDEWLVDYVIYEMMSEYSADDAPEGTFHHLFRTVTFGLFTKAPRPHAASYDLSQDIRASLKKQLVEMASQIRQGNPVKLTNYIDIEGGNKKQDLMVVMINAGEMEVRNVDDQSVCTMTAGDIIDLVSQFPNTTSTTMTVRYAHEDGESCRVGKTVAIPHDELQRGINRMTQRLQRAAQKVIELKPGIH